MMMAMKAAVAFQTMPHTTGMSLQCTTPVASEMAAPRQALQPMPSPRGCQITSVRVNRKMTAAVIMLGVRGCKALRRRARPGSNCR